MFELMGLGVLLVCGLIVVGTIGVILKLAFWVVLFPLRLALKLIALPFLLVGVAIKLAFGLLLLPILGVVGLIAVVGLVIGGILAILVPLLPVLLVGLAIVAVVKSRAKPAVLPPA
jgi:hypothetical protein